MINQPSWMFILWYAKFIFYSLLLNTVSWLLYLPFLIKFIDNQFHLFTHSFWTINRRGEFTTELYLKIDLCFFLSEFLGWRFNIICNIRVRIVVLIFVVFVATLCSGWLPRLLYTPGRPEATMIETFCDGDGRDGDGGLSVNSVNNICVCSKVVCLRQRYWRTSKHFKYLEFLQV